MTRAKSGKASGWWAAQRDGEPGLVCPGGRIGAWAVTPDSCQLTSNWPSPVRQEIRADWPAETAEARQRARASKPIVRHMGSNSPADSCSGGTISRVPQPLANQSLQSRWRSWTQHRERTANQRQRDWPVNRLQLVEEFLDSPVVQLQPVPPLRQRLLGPAPYEVKAHLHAVQQVPAAVAEAAQFLAELLDLPVALNEPKQRAT